MKKNNLVHTPHDKLFRTALQYPQVAREFLKLYLQSDIQKNMDFSTLHYCPTTFIDEKLNLSQVDVLFKAKIYSKDAYIYILAEQESKIDNLISFWMMKYLMCIWDYHIKNNGESKAVPLPMIVPLVFYTGDKPYSAPLELWKLFGEQSESMKTILQAPLHVIDVGSLPEKELTSHVFAGTMAFMLRKQFRKHITQEIVKIIDNINVLENSELHRYVVDLIKYIFGINEGYKKMKELLTLIHDKSSPAVEKTMSSIAEQLMEEGFEKGKLEGKMELIKTMLANGVEPVFIAKNTGVSIQKIKELQNKN